MVTVSSANEVRAWPIKHGWHGWHVAPSGDRVNLGANVKLGHYVTLGDGVTLGNAVKLGDGVTLGDGVKLGDAVTLGDKVKLGDGVTLGNWVKIGNHVTLGNNIKLGDSVTLGNHVTLGDRVTLGDGVKLGNSVRLGAGVTLGDKVMLGNWVTLGNNVTSEALNEEARKAYRELGPEHVFVKWVDLERQSPNWHGGFLYNRIHYAKGAHIEVPEAEVSDKQCAPGIHVFRYGQRPEWSGLGVGEELIPLRVRVRSEDILFAGLPGNDAKIRVRAVDVLD